METYEKLMEYIRNSKTYKIAANLFTDATRIFPYKNQTEETRIKRDDFIKSGIEALLENDWWKKIDIIK